nr:non-ribosomal peptide synthetase [uncultured Cellulosilyticum sp.]
MSENSIIQYLEKNSIETPNKMAFNFFSYVNDKKRDLKISCKEVFEGAKAYATYFKEVGVCKGDRIIICAEQRPETIYAIYGSLMVGGVFILVPTPKDKNKEERLISTINSSNAKYIVYNGVKLEVFKMFSMTLINVNQIKVENIQYVKWVEEIKSQDIACLQYTSGSTNDPKGIIFTHENIITCMELLQSAYHLTEKDISTSWLPLFHSMGLLVGIFYNAYVNRSDYIMDIEVFKEKPIRWLKAISKYGATFILAPNSAYMTCTKVITTEELLNLNFSKVKYMVNCSEIIQRSNWEIIFDTFSKCGLSPTALCPMYGLSEATGPVSVGDGKLKFFEADWLEVQNNKVVSPTIQTKKTKVMSGVGKLIDGLKVIIVDPKTLTECHEHEIGEVWVQGKSIAAGYWNDPRLTKEVFRARLEGDEGEFLRTGDLGTIIGGELYITGRIKEMMVINGKNIYAKDIELYIKSNIPELKLITLYAFTMAIKKGERIIIAVEYSGEKAGIPLLVKKINEVLYAYFTIEAYDVFFILPNELPRTENGKLALMKIYHKYVNKEFEILYSSKLVRKNKAKTEFNEVQLKIKKIFDRILDTNCTSITDNLLDLGATSIEVCNLVTQLKKTFDVKVTLKQIIKDPTIQGIEESILKNKEMQG